MADLSPVGLLSLPNEILISILSRHTTLTLLTYIPTCRHIHNLTLLIIDHRLNMLCSLPEHDLILECYHPAMQYLTPHMRCRYLSTSALTPTSSSSPPQQSTLQGLKELYTTFQPLSSKKGTNSPRPHPAGGFFTPMTFLSIFLSDDKDDSVRQQIHLESHELFTQLCAGVKILRKGVGNGRSEDGLYRRNSVIGSGTLRVWRDWLAERSKIDMERYGEMGDSGNGGVLWLGTTTDIGLKLAVEKVEDEGVVGVGREGEDEDVTFRLQFQELIVRSSHLLLKVEESIEQEAKDAGKALIIGSWL